MSSGQGKDQEGGAAGGGGRRFREVQLQEPIRSDYAYCTVKPIYCNAAWVCIVGLRPRSLGLLVGVTVTGTVTVTVTEVTVVSAGFVALTILMFDHFWVFWGSD